MGEKCFCCRNISKCVYMGRLLRSCSTHALRNVVAQYMSKLQKMIHINKETNRKENKSYFAAQGRLLARISNMHA